jgi:hypothetical protein
MSVTNLYNFDPDYISVKIASNDWVGCWEYLAEVIENMTITASAESLMFSLQMQKDMKDEKGKQYVNDFGALLGELILFLLTNPAASLPDKSFMRMIIFHETLHTLFYIFNMSNTDALVRGLMGDGKKKLSTTDQKKLLLLYSLDSTISVSEILKAVDTTYRVAAVISYFSHRKIFRENVYANKAELYKWRREFEKSAKEADDVFLNNVTAYFLSSYMNLPEKHLIKENVNAVCRQHLARMDRDLKKIRAIPENPFNFKLDPAKPTILVITELFARNHAMYRGWGKITKSLASEFNIIFTMPSDRADLSLRNDFENFEVFDTFGDLYRLMHLAKADIIFMPSVGMRFYNVLVSNMRMAPIQVMGLGHPATTMSEFIDYVVSPKNLYDAAAFPKDTYIADGYPEKHTPIVSKEKFFAPLAPEDMPKRPDSKRVLEVGVCGSDIKVSAPFFRLLKEIVETAPFDIHVTFMMGVGGIDSLYIEKFLKENFANSTYYGHQPYEDYLKAIKRVDIMLNPFPFGHTNTIIDTLMCGKPCVGLDGPEPSSKTEGDVLNAVGLKDMFVAKDEAEYKAKFLSLAERILAGDTVFYDREKVYERIFADLGDYDYGKVMKWLYDNHAKLKSSRTKYAEVFSEI